MENLQNLEKLKKQLNLLNDMINDDSTNIFILEELQRAKDKLFQQFKLTFISFFILPCIF